MFNNFKKHVGKLAAAAALAAASVPANAASTLTMPTIDLTDFYAAVTLILGVGVAVMIVRRVRGQIQ